MEVKEMKRFLSIKIILLICLLGVMVSLIGCTPSVSIHTGTVSGVINVYWPGVSFMPGAARIDVLGEGIFTVSSFSDGTYTLSNIPAGQHTITVFKHGYITAQQIVNVVEGQTVTSVDFNLETEISAEQIGGLYYHGFNLDMEGFSTDLYYNILNSGFHHFVAQKIQTYLAQVGIDAELHEIGWTELLGSVSQGELPFFRLGWTADTPDPTDFLYSLYHSASSDNYVHYINSTVDSLIEQAWETIDETDFIQLIQQIESTIVDDAPAIYLYHYQ
jgi:ABC-type oligopeptide transport system substrate-binding subunit